MTTWSSGAEVADALGQQIAVLEVLHRVMGSAALRATEPAVVVVLDEVALQHAWQATELRSHLPKRDGVDLTALIDLGDLRGIESVLDDIAGDPTVLLAAYRERVLPRVRTMIEALRGRCSETADRSLQRALHLALADLDLVDQRLAELGWGADPLKAAVAKVPREPLAGTWNLGGATAR